MLQAEKLVLLTNIPGVLNKAGELLTDLTSREIDALFADGTISGGMLPKIAGALDAAKAGVNAVHIIDGRVPHAMLLEILTRAGLRHDDPQPLRRWRSWRGQKGGGRPPSARFTRVDAGRWQAGPSPRGPSMAGRWPVIPFASHRSPTRQLIADARVDVARTRKKRVKPLCENQLHSPTGHARHSLRHR